ncbi:MAG TPA: septum formation initiator family protein [bacterium]|nr:septum formation initiator family protein [bacterium]
MSERYKKQIATSARRRKKLKVKNLQPHRKIYMSLFIVIMLYVALYFGNLHYQNYIFMERQLSQVLSERQYKHDEIKRLNEEKTRLNDPDYLKDYARENLYLMDPKEVHIKITPNPAVNEDENIKGKRSGKRK